MSKVKLINSKKNHSGKIMIIHMNQKLQFLRRSGPKSMDILGELAGGGSVAVAVGISNM